MSNRISAHPGRPLAFYTIVYGGLAVGVLDGLAALFVSGFLRGVSPTVIFQYIASGLLGSAAFSGGSATFLLGILLHFLNAFIIAAFFYLASLFFPVLIRRAAVAGPAYGIAVYFVMNYVVIPLSVASAIAFSWNKLLSGLIVHVLCVGLPVALFARWSAKTQPATEQYLAKDA